MRRKPLPAVLAALLSLALVAVAVAQTSSPTRLNLPNGWQPEGIASGAGNALYVGSIPAGAALRLGARTGRSRVIVGARNGHRAYGVKAVAGQLFVAGGPSGRAWVYRA